MSASALILREGVAPIRDRLMATLFLAALLHGLVILGLTFGAVAGPGPDAPGLKVLIVSVDVPEAGQNDDAAYLAQRTQLGSGTTQEATTPRNRTRAGEPPNPPPSPTDQFAGETVVKSSAPSLSLRYVAPSGVDAAPSRPLADPLPAPSRELATGSDPDDAELEGDLREELWVTPDTRESLVAPYLDAWRRKIERLGTLNYPAAARHARGRSPIVEVAIGADGVLVKAEIRGTSGSAELDEAAIAILELASPFEPFPRELAAHYRVLRFAYAWQFEGSAAAPGTVTAPADSR